MEETRTKKLRLNFRAGIPEEDLLGRVMGHDNWGAFYYVQAVFSLPDRTEVNLMPLSPDETRIRKDEFMQEWVTF